MKKDILICGVGGQGTVLASKIIAASAMDEGSAVHSAETIGMAQRGEQRTGKAGDRILAGYRVRRHRDDCISAEEMQLYRNRCRENLCTVWLITIFQYCHLRRGSWKRTAWNQQGNRACRA